MTLDEAIQLTFGILLLIGWIGIAGFGIGLYLDLRHLSREVLGARLFLNLNSFLRGFLFLSVGFGAILVSIVPGLFHLPGALYVSFAGGILWFVLTGLALYSIFKSLHIPRAVRRRFGSPQELPQEERGGP